jgi:hypothetical protein
MYNDESLLLNIFMTRIVSPQTILHHTFANLISIHWMHYIRASRDMKVWNLVVSVARVVHFMSTFIAQILKHKTALAAGDP